MNAEEFRAWLEDHEACEDALQWLGKLPEPSLQAAWDACPRGDWMLWLHTRAGTGFEILAPVVYNTVNRALERAASALDSAGIEHDLEGVVVKDRASAHAAWDAARAAAEAAAAAAEFPAEAAAEAAEYASEVAVEAAEFAAEFAAEGGGDAAEFAAEAANDAAVGATWVVAGSAELAAWTVLESEQRRCADDCRELLEMPTMKEEPR